MRPDLPEPLLLYGAGGHAKSVIGALEASGRYSIAAIVDDRVDVDGMTVMGYAVTGGPAALKGPLSDGIRFAMVTVGDNPDRARLCSMIVNAGFNLATIIHPLAWMAPDCAIDIGSFVHVYAVVGPDSRIGRGTIISAQAVVGHDTCIGDWAHLAPGVHIGGNAVVGEGAFLGMGCSILPNVRVGEYASIGANSVVHKDIPARTVVAGNPARVVKSA